MNYGMNDEDSIRQIDDRHREYFLLFFSPVSCKIPSILFFFTKIRPNTPIFRGGQPKGSRARSVEKQGKVSANGNELMFGGSDFG